MQKGREKNIFRYIASVEGFTSSLVGHIKPSSNLDSEQLGI